MMTDTSTFIVLTGSLGVNHADELKAHEPFNTLVLSAAANETGVHLTALKDDTRFVLASLFKLTKLPGD
jgi:quercetin 2,3-dioxygenase